MNKMKNYAITTAGIILLLSGLYLLKTTENPQAFMASLPYVCIGIGCGIFGNGISKIITSNIMEKEPDLQKQLEINQNDERNVTIANRAKGKAYDLMTFVFGILMVTFALMGVDMVPILLFVITYLLVQGYAIYYRCKYEKEM